MGVFVVAVFWVFLLREFLDLWSIFGVFCAKNFLVVGCGGVSSSGGFIMGGCRFRLFIMLYCVDRFLSEAWGVSGVFSE